MHVKPRGRGRPPKPVACPFCFRSFSTRELRVHLGKCKKRPKVQKETKACCRHIKSCVHRDQGREYRHCRCPVWADGILQGERINQSLNTRNWEAAQGIARIWELRKAPVSEEPEHVTVEHAVDAFLADVEYGRQLSNASLKKYRVLLRNEPPKKNPDKVSLSLTEFCPKNALRFTSELRLEWLAAFRQSWKDKNISAAKKRERLCAFCAFLVERGWMPVNYAKN